MSQQNGFIHYRSSNIGIALQQALKELVIDDKLDEETAHQATFAFDEAMSNCLANEELVNAKLDIRSKLDSYRNCDEVWSFTMADPEFIITNSTTGKLYEFHSEYATLMALDGKNPGGAARKKD